MKYSEGDFVVDKRGRLHKILGVLSEIEIYRTETCNIESTLKEEDIDIKETNRLGY